MAHWLRSGSQGREAYCQCLEVMGLNPSLVELWVRSSVVSRN